MLECASPEVQVRFNGKNSTVIVGKNIKWKKGLVLNVSGNCFVDLGDGSTFTGDSMILSAGAKLAVGKNCKVGAKDIFLNYGGEIQIGDNVTCELASRFRTGCYKRIVIGNDCMFSWQTVLLASDGHLIFDTKDGNCINAPKKETENSIVIGEHVWFGGESVVLPESTIGSGSIVGYRALVKGKFPNNAVLAGSPARVVKKDVAWARQNQNPEDVWKRAKDKVVF